jgi:hypothetical protein
MGDLAWGEASVYADEVIVTGELQLSLEGDAKGVLTEE